jgi:EAL domain-containing protein (putative c-di-GMP-specific phosphodiesterase class I)
MALNSLPPLARDQMLFLNVEPDSTLDPELSQGAFLDQLHRSGLEPEQVVLEITEHRATKDFDTLRDTLALLRSRGLRLAMDDVGSGYSGWQAIVEMRPEFLKADMSLVRGLDQQPVKRELISSIRRFTESTGSVLVAEGVETHAELRSLAGQGVRCAQGYLLAKPASPPQVPCWEAIDDSVGDDRQG